MKFYKRKVLRERVYDDGTITDDETGEVLFTSSNDLYKYLVEKFKSLTEQEIFELIGTRGIVDTFDGGGAFYITPSGKLVSVNEALDGKNMIHHDLLYGIIDKLYLKVTHQKNGFVEEISGIDNEDFDWMLDDVLTGKLGWVRCNTGTSRIEDRFYCVLTDSSPKGVQWAVLEEWMEWGESHRKENVLVFFSPSGRPFKRYPFESNGFGYYADDIIKLMKRYYASGVLYEDKECLTEDIEGMKKYYPNIPEEEFMGYIQLDPTYKKGSTQAGKYAKWILGLANKGKIDNIELLAKVLVDFEEAKPHLVNADIMKYKSAEEVADALDDENSYKELSRRQEVRQRQKARKYADLGNESMKLYESSVQKDSIVLQNGDILSWGWEKGYNGGHFYVERAFKISDSDVLYQTEFHKTYATEQDAKRAYNRYRLKKESCDSALNEVYPNKGESKDDFISRFMSVTKDEYPDTKQRYAVALSYWDRRKKNEAVEGDRANLIAFLDTISFDDVDEEGIDEEIGKYSVSVWATESHFGSAWLPHKVVNIQIDRNDMPNGYLGSTDIESEEELKHQIDRLKEKIYR